MRRVSRAEAQTAPALVADREAPAWFMHPAESSRDEIQKFIATTLLDHDPAAHAAALSHLKKNW
eukprot:7647493-Alexandrium_andersonii.AAC.1